MLIRFVVSNFLSFDKETEFNMLAGTFKTHKHHVYNAGKVNVLKAAAIYGANGAGKSNLIKAIDFLQEVVKVGFIKQSVNGHKFKLNRANIDKPIVFEIEFSIKKKIYSYGIIIDHISILEEWLYESGINVEDKLIFERKNTKSGKISIKVADRYYKTQKQKYLVELMEENLLKGNELFLSKSDSIKINEISNCRNWIKDDLIIIFPGSKFQYLVAMIATSEGFNNLTNDLLKTFDTGVNELGIESTNFEKFFGEEDDETKQDIIENINKEEYILFESKLGMVLITKEKSKYIVKKVVAQHKNNFGERVSFDLINESDGTQRLLDFIPAFDMILRHDITFIIDEIDQSLHPVLLRSLVHKIMIDEGTKGQLLFSTHESNLLDMAIFRQDEIWFAEKDKSLGGTQLYSLSEFKPRYDLDIRKGYLKGRFGAIPFLADLDDLNWHDYES